MPVVVQMRAAPVQHLSRGGESRRRRCCPRRRHGTRGGARAVAANLGFKFISILADIVIITVLVGVRVCCTPAAAVATIDDCGAQRPTRLSCICRCGRRFGGPGGHEGAAQRPQLTEPHREPAQVLHGAEAGRQLVGAVAAITTVYVVTIDPSPSIPGIPGILVAAPRAVVCSIRRRRCRRSTRGDGEVLRRLHGGTHDQLARLSRASMREHEVRQSPGGVRLEVVRTFVVPLVIQVGTLSGREAGA
mmetsp:Transcript_29860/g.74714  ORF Transcript_29860/g.74714 Transcript_29860/m.74714 type:complete len:247 (+) Transcript_29860:620-1360(+)